MSDPARARCVTCSDEATVGVVASVEGTEALVRVNETVERVGVDLIADAAAGDVLLCHAGIALARLEPEEAQSNLARNP